MKYFRSLVLLLALFMGAWNVTAENAAAVGQKLPLRSEGEVYCFFTKMYTVKSGEFVTPKFIYPYSDGLQIIVEDRQYNRFSIPLSGIDRSKLNTPLLCKNNANRIYLANGLFRDLDLKGRTLSELIEEWGEYTEHYYSAAEKQHYYTFMNVRIANVFSRGVGIQIVTDENFVVTEFRERGWTWHLFCALPFYADIMSLNLMSRDTEFVTEEEYKSNNGYNKYNKYKYSDVLKKLFLFSLIYTLCLAFLMLAMAFCRFIPNLLIVGLPLIINYVVPYIFIISFLEKYPLNWFCTLLIGLFLWGVDGLIIMFGITFLKRCPECKRLRCYSESEVLNKIECSANIKFQNDPKSIYPLSRTVLTCNKEYKKTESCDKCHSVKVSYSTKTESNICPNCGKPLYLTAKGGDMNYGDIVFKRVSKSQSKEYVRLVYEYYYHVGCTDCGWSWNGEPELSTREIPIEKFMQLAANEDIAAETVNNSSATSDVRSNDTRRNRGCDEDNENREATEEKQRKQEEKQQHLREAEEARREYEYYKSKVQELRDQADTERNYARDAEWKYDEFKDDSYRSLANDYYSKAESCDREAQRYEREAENYYRQYQEATSRASSIY